MALNLFGALVVAAIAGIAIGMIYYEKKRLAIVMGVVAMVVTLIIATLVPMMVIIMIVSGMFVALLLSYKDKDPGVIFFSGVLLVMLLFFGSICVLQNQPYTTTRELTQNLDLIAVKENTQFNGHFFFLSGSMGQSDYYEYRYIDGIGSRLGRISKFAPLIVEDANLTDKGTLRRYQTYRTVNEMHGIIKFLYDDLPKRSAVGQEEVEIYVPVGSVDRTISSL